VVDRVVTYLPKLKSKCKSILKDEEKSSSASSSSPHLSRVIETQAASQLDTPDMGRRS